MSIWRGELCPARGPGLSHTQNFEVYADGRCVHCKLVVQMTPPDGVPDTASEAGLPKPAEYASIFDHLYVFSLWGKCGRRGCDQVREAHAAYLIGTAVDQCSVDHRSVKPWTECGICHDIVEPKLNAPTPLESYPDDRVWFSSRQRSKLEAVFAAWVGGYFKP